MAMRGVHKAVNFIELRAERLEPFFCLVVEVEPNDIKTLDVAALPRLSLGNPSSPPGQAVFLRAIVLLARGAIRLGMLTQIEKELLKRQNGLLWVVVRLAVVSNKTHFRWHGLPYFDGNNGNFVPTRNREGNETGTFFL